MTGDKGEAGDRLEVKGGGGGGGGGGSAAARMKYERFGSPSNAAADCKNDGHHAFWYAKGTEANAGVLRSRRSTTATSKNTTRLDQYLQDRVDHRRRMQKGTKRGGTHKVDVGVELALDEVFILQGHVLQC